MAARKILSVVVLAFCLGLCAEIAYPGEWPPPGFMGMAGICTDQNHLYAVAGGKIMQYSLTDMTLQKSVELPEPPLPPSSPPAAVDGGMVPPPPPPGRSQWLLTNEGSLYVMAGPMIHRYSLPDLELQNSVELPKPELPQLSNLSR